MNLPFGADFKYEEDGILFKVFHLKNKKVKVSAKLGTRTVFDFGRSPYEAAEKAKKRLLKDTLS